MLRVLILFLTFVAGQPCAVATTSLLSTHRGSKFGHVYNVPVLPQQTCPATTIVLNLMFELLYQPCATATHLFRNNDAGSLQQLENIFNVTPMAQRGPQALPHRNQVRVGYYYYFICFMACWFFSTVGAREAIVSLLITSSRTCIYKVTECCAVFIVYGKYIY